MRRWACLRPCFVLRACLDLGFGALYLRVFLALRLLCFTLDVPCVETERLDFGELLRFLLETAALTSGTPASGAKAFSLIITFGTYSFSSLIPALRLYRTIGTSFPSIEFLFSLNTLLRLFADDLPLERAL